VGGGSASRSPTEITLPNGGRSQPTCFQQPFFPEHAHRLGASGQQSWPAHRTNSPASYLTVDRRSTSCGGERSFAVAELAAFYKDRTVGEVLRLMRCSRGCGGRVLAAWLETGPVLNQRVRPRRVPLLGPEARE
jgi:hypothetical protein